jgi:hypothetical protein
MQLKNTQNMMCNEHKGNGYAILKKKEKERKKRRHKEIGDRVHAIRSVDCGTRGSSMIDSQVRSGSCDLTRRSNMPAVV